MRGRMTAETRIKLNHAFDQVVFDRTSEARKVLVHPSGFAIVRSRSGAPSDLQSNAGAPKVTDVRMRNAFFHSIGSLPGGLCPLDKSKRRRCVSACTVRGSRSTDARAAERNSKYRVFHGANRPRWRGLQQAREETHARGYAGDGLSQSTAIIRATPPIPLWSYRHTHRRSRGTQSETF